MNKTTPVRSAFETPADSTVEDILRDSERKQAEAGLSQDERRQVIERRRRQQEKREKAQRKAQAQLPNRINLNLPLDLKASLESIAKWNRVTVSQVVTCLLYEAVDQVQSGQINLAKYKVPSESPRYEYALLHPKDTERQQNLASTKKMKSGWGGQK